MSSQNTVLAWVDFETTGLRPVSKHRILEYAVVFTDLHLNEIEAVTGVIPQHMNIARSLMDQFVIDMHSGNGLLEELDARESEATDYNEQLASAEDSILEAMERARSRASDHEVEVIFVIAGNTVGFDKSYIDTQMPRLFEALHYRQMDVSAYKVGFPETFGTKTSESHRAMDDIRGSIESHRKMREIVLAGQKALSRVSMTASKPTFDEDDCC